MRKFDATDEHAKGMIGDLPNISQKGDAHVIFITHLELQIVQLSTTVNPCQPSTVPKKTIQNP